MNKSTEENQQNPSHVFYPPTVASSTFLVAFCGIDGAGKGTLIEEVMRTDLLPGSVLVKNTTHRRTANLMREFIHREHQDWRDWLDGGFASCSPFANAFDFLDHYKHNIEPLLGVERYVICDRYALCSAAYLAAMGHSLPARTLFAKVRPPDLTLYVSTDIKLLEARYANRGGATEDETPALMRQYKAGFESLIPEMTCRVINVHNNRTPEDAHRTVAQAIQEALEQWQSCSDALAASKVTAVDKKGH